MDRLEIVAHPLRSLHMFSCGHGRIEISYLTSDTSSIQVFGPDACSLQSMYIRAMRFHVASQEIDN